MLHLMQVQTDIPCIIVMPWYKKCGIIILRQYCCSSESPSSSAPMDWFASTVGVMKQSTHSFHVGCSLAFSTYATRSSYVFSPSCRNSQRSAATIIRNAFIDFRHALPFKMVRSPDKFLNTCTFHVVLRPLVPINDIRVCIIRGCNTTHSQCTGSLHFI